ncbi:MAG: hypothetical protein GEU88_18720 [Solirubrobacterales bacterium]|nr:hypothetical protein [Solirubrobacterales bacterium]
MTTQQTPPRSTPPAPPPTPQRPGGAASEVETAPPTPRRTLFSVPFHSAMGDADIAHLRAELGMTTHFHPKHPAVVPALGVVRLDFHSGLFLVRGEGDGEWSLECRTWGEPFPAVVRGWQLHAAYAARALDPSAPAPPHAGA